MCETELRLEEIICRVDEPMSLPRVKTNGCFSVALPSNGGRVVPHGPHSTDNLTLTSYFEASKWRYTESEYIYIYIYIRGRGRILYIVYQKCLLPRILGNKKDLSLQRRRWPFHKIFLLKAKYIKWTNTAIPSHNQVNSYYILPAAFIASNLHM